MKTITSLSKIDKRKYKLYIDEELFGALYFGEVRKFQLEEGMCIEESTLDELKQILTRRAKERSLYILGLMDKTEYEIRKKLRQNYYSDAIIQKTIEFLKSYNYIDDNRYATQFVKYKESSKSVRQMKEQLATKGIPKNIIQELFNNYECKELELLDTLILKKLRDRSYTDIEDKERQKIFAFLFRKGFRYGDIKQHMQKYS